MGHTEEVCPKTKKASAAQTAADSKTAAAANANEPGKPGPKSSKKVDPTPAKKAATTTPSAKPQNTLVDDEEPGWQRVTSKKNKKKNVTKAITNNVIAAALKNCTVQLERIPAETAPFTLDVAVRDNTTASQAPAVSTVSEGSGEGNSRDDTAFFQAVDELLNTLQEPVTAAKKAVRRPAASKGSEPSDSDTEVGSISSAAAPPRKTGRKSQKPRKVVPMDEGQTSGNEGAENAGMEVSPPEELPRTDVAPAMQGEKVSQVSSEMPCPEQLPHQAVPEAMEAEGGSQEAPEVSPVKELPPSTVPEAMEAEGLPQVAPDVHPSCSVPPDPEAGPTAPPSQQ